MSNIKNGQKGFASLILVGVIVILVAVGVYFVLVKKNISEKYYTYNECAEKTKLPCTFNFVGDLGHEWLPSSFHTQQECENAIPQVGRTCLIPPGNFSEVRWVSATDLSTSQKENLK